MLTNIECSSALANLYFIALLNCQNEKLKVKLQKEFNVLVDLINEHFENSADFNHFKLHADSTLKTFTKDELIDYIHMLYYNWQSTDWYYNNTVKVNYKLQSEVDELKSNQTFELELTRDECELIVDALKPWEEELGWDVTLLIEKIEKYKSLLPKGEGVVEYVEID